MAKVTQAAKVGAFVLAAGAATYLVYRLVNKEVGSGEGYTVHAYLDDATGLANHSRVTIAGIGVGSIEKIYLEQPPNGGPARARVDIKVKRDVPLYQNATVGKKSASLLGESMLVITAGTDEPKLKEGDEIHTMPPEPS